MTSRNRAMYMKISIFFSLTHSLTHSYTLHMALKFTPLMYYIANERERESERREYKQQRNAHADDDAFSYYYVCYKYISL